MLAPSIHVHEELSAEKIIGVVRRQRTQQPLFDLADLDPAQAVEFYAYDLNWSNRLILGDSLTVMTSLLDRERLSGKVQCIYIDPPYGVNYKSNFQPSVSSTDVSEDDAGLSREPEMIQAYRDTWELGVHSYRVLVVIYRDSPVRIGSRAPRSHRLSRSPLLLDLCDDLHPT